MPERHSRGIVSWLRPAPVSPLLPLLSVMLCTYAALPLVRTSPSSGSSPPSDTTTRDASRCISSPPQGPRTPGDVHPGAAHPGAQRGPLTHPRASCAREDGSSKTRSMAGRDSEFAAQPVPGARFGWAESGEPSAARREYRSARLAVREPCLTRRPDDIRGCGDVRCRPSGRRTRRCRGTCPSIESRDAYDAPTQRALRRPSRYVGFIVNRP